MIRTPTICRRRPPPQLWKTLSRRTFAALLMASSPLETRSTGVVLDFTLRAAGAAPHRAAGLLSLSSTAACCIVGRCLWAGQRTRWTQDVSKPMPPASLRGAIQASALGIRGFIILAALLSASPHARGCDGGATPKDWPHADERARRNTLEPVLVHVCRPSEYMSVVSVISVYQIYMIYL